MLTLEEIVDATFARFGTDHAKPFEALNKGGSGRVFCRGGAGGRSMVIAHYEHDREDNRHFVNIARFLEENGIPAARVLAHDEAARIIWMVDLGDTDLWAYREAPWEEKEQAYRETLQTIVALHRVPLGPAHDRGVLLQREFDADLYRWEQHYFFDHCLRDHFRWPEEKIAPLRELPALGEMAERLAAEPRVPVHRDFQSQNVMMFDGKAWLIDFQGLRPGLAGYDIASLLADPYADLPASEQAMLLEAYAEIAELDEAQKHAFFSTYPYLALQRLLQALGAYGNLAYRLGKVRYLDYIPIGLRQLLRHLEILAGFDPLTAAVEECLGLQPPQTGGNGKHPVATA